ncbi:PorP/SprF family type IX secretion system membrane protein [Chitinophaga pollutisoli]|uniref:PorP/SprF family type IX secretion system membrane protein n=1 Tax=Chitinophaga pollutisoli TaxID=3133966 RepID=A0ABZ2YP43_9BACT
MKKISTQLCLLFLTLMLPYTVEAQRIFDQQDPLPQQYFENRYLGNPALAGADTGLSLSMGYRKAWKESADAPVSFSLTGDYQLLRTLGVGLTVFNDQSGPLKQTRVAMSYAYHTPLNDEGSEFLHVGASVSLDNKRVESLKPGTPAEQALKGYEGYKNAIGADLGIAYTNRKLTLQATMPNVTRTFKNLDDAEPRGQATFAVTASYSFGMRSYKISSIEPLISFRAMLNSKSVVDAGARLSFARNLVNVFGLYHSNKAVTGGVGFQFKNSIQVQASYTNQPAGLDAYGGNFGLGIKVRLFN